MSENRINAYRVMWLFTMFDLPVTTKKERKAAAIFRKELVKDGFTMLQFSVYIRHCPSVQSQEVHTKRVKGLLPETGKVSILAVTDKQYSMIQNFVGLQVKKVGKIPLQLELF
ncbi:MAG: CRISPR-associated endonuclease Cas2 [Bacteroidales bacterium]|nr:CRISPR-associated endonuclease Cas2 [Bacteroidales bacterium]